MVRAISNYLIVLVAVLVTVLTLGCIGPADSVVEDASPASAAIKASGVLKNLHQPSSRVYSGAEPTDDEAFAAIAALGIQTVVSVDGVPPNVALAAQHGLRYVHIPIGYGGVDDFAQRSLFRLVTESEGAFYIHCHHGRHRGPAAAAIACQADGAFDAKQAITFLEKAGTDRNYAGLYRDVAEYVRPTGAELPELVSRAETEPLARQMAGIDRHFDRVEELAKTKDAAAMSQHAVLLEQSFRELLRGLKTEDSEYPAEFRELVASSEQLAARLSGSESKQPRNEVARSELALDVIEQLRHRCTHCHQKYRDGG